MSTNRQNKAFAATAKLTAALALALASACPAAAMSTPFEVVKGSWVGGDALNFKDGHSEKLSCNAYYTGSTDGKALTTALRCSGPSGKVELRSHLNYASGKVSGGWEERTYNASGDASGILNPGNLRLNFHGGVSGSMRVAFSASSQTVSISIGRRPTISRQPARVGRYLGPIRYAAWQAVQSARMAPSWLRAPVLVPPAVA
jgi:hypothetical protein